MEQLIHKDMQDTWKQCASLWQTVGGKVLHNSPSDVTAPHLGLSFQGVRLFHLNFSSCNLFHHHSKIKGKNSKPLILGKPLDISSFYVQMEILCIGFPPYILLLFYIVN